MIVDTNNKIPIKMWLKEIEAGALMQASNLANLPFVFKHIALMPDCHQGYGMPVGGVMATKGVVVPNAVGVDIGCGMCAVKTSLTEIDTDTLKKIMGEIRKTVPVGFNKHKEPLHSGFLPSYKFDTDDHTCPIVYQEWENARLSLGTLGGGNHFIEIQKGDDGHIWIMIHSGSRNLGLKVANHYNKLAKVLNAKWHTGIDPKWDLAFLPLDSEEGKAYIKEMNYCVEFALANRKLMMDRICEIFKEIIPYEESYKNEYNENSEDNEWEPGIEFKPMINIAHNYASMENHFGQNVMVHRKGATKATKGLIGIIPGSQGTKSYIVKGKGNKQSFESCSHGAGRKMGRKVACETLDLATEQKILDDQGIIHNIRNQDDLDEAPSSYKDISVVMENQKELVNIEVELTPLAVIKG